MRKLREIVECIKAADRFNQLHQRLFTDTRLRQLKTLLTNGDLDRVIDLDAEVAHGALDLRMPEQ